MVSTILANLEGCQERVQAGRLRLFGFLVFWFFGFLVFEQGRFWPISACHDWPKTTHCGQPVFARTPYLERG
ncbi:hypothetical protein D3C76_442360 [compost metagenome]